MLSFLIMCYKNCIHDNNTKLFLLYRKEFPKLMNVYTVFVKPSLWKLYLNIKRFVQVQVLWWNKINNISVSMNESCNFSDSLDSSCKS